MEVIIDAYEMANIDKYNANKAQAARCICLSNLN
jgi:hypothetical protein